MKKRVVSMVCAVLFVMNLCGIAGANAAVQPSAETQASYYFGATSVRAYAKGSGKVLVEFDVTATHTMLEVGATDVYIYEQQSDGDYENVYTFTSDKYYSSMMDTNSAFGNGEVTYQGISGRKYFATVAVYARDSAGSETRYYDTYVITA